MIDDGGKKVGEDGEDIMTAAVSSIWAITVIHIVHYQSRHGQVVFFAIHFKIKINLLAFKNVILEA